MVKDYSDTIQLGILSNTELRHIARSLVILRKVDIKQDLFNALDIAIVYELEEREEHEAETGTR